MNIESSNGCKYSEDLWKETVLEWLPKASGLFKKLPTEVALNKGSLFDNNNFELFGNRAVELECILDKMDFRAIDTPKRNPLSTATVIVGKKNKDLF